MRFFLLFIIVGLTTLPAYSVNIEKPILLLNSSGGGTNQYLDSTTVEYTGNLQFDFKSVNLGDIVYTLDGSVPSTNNGTVYNNGKSVTVTQNLTLKAVHAIYANLYSAILTVTFVKAKSPLPLAQCGPTTNFYPSITCTLTVPSPPQSVIHYTTDGSTPTKISTTYFGALTFYTSTTLTAISVATNYANSDPLKINLTYLDPVVNPAAFPTSKKFASSSITVKLTTPTSGAIIRYTTDTTALLDTCTIISGDSITLKPKKINDTLVLRAQAYKTGYPNSQIITERYIYLPAVSAPVPSVAPGIYYDTLTVQFTTPTQGDTIFYSHGATLPSRSSTEVTGPILISGKDDTLNAISVKAPQPSSAIFIGVYTFKLSPPVADKPTRQFMDSINIFLTSPCPGALIYYTLNGSVPNKNSTLYTTKPPQKPISISNDTTDLYAIAIKDNVISNVSVNRYTKAAVIGQLSEPNITPAGRQFTGNLSVTLETSDPNAEIHYTKNGTIPSLNSPVYSSPLVLDTSTILNARTFPITGNSEPSNSRQEAFTSLPSTPIASPISDQAFSDSVRITLTTPNKHGLIFYGFGDTLPKLNAMLGYKAGQVIPLYNSSKLQAITLYITGTDTLRSATLVQPYDIIASPPSETINNGASRPIAGGFTIANNSNNPIIAKTITTNGLGIVGFKEAGTVIQISPQTTGQTIAVSFKKSPTDLNAIYSVSNGLVTFISKDTLFNINTPGNYFAGIDTVPPTISFVSQSGLGTDSTSIRLSVKDNVINPIFEINSSGISPGTSSGKRTVNLDSQGFANISLKNPSTVNQSLWLNAKASDRINTTYLPRDSSAKFYLPRIFNLLTTPAIFTLGNPNYAWDLVGFPLDETHTLSWTQLQKDNAAVQLEAMSLSDSVNYDALNDNSILAGPRAIWLASHTATSTLNLSQFQSSQSELTGNFKMTLQHGWNMVTSPSLDKIVWPFSRKDNKYCTYNVKGLYKFVSTNGNYAFADTLEPWKGFFVYYKGLVDTTLLLNPNDASIKLFKTSANFGVLGKTENVSHSPVEIIFGNENSIPLSLKADSIYTDEVAREDEIKLPEIKAQNSLWSQRGKYQLTTDQLHFRNGKILSWTLIVRSVLDSNAMAKNSTHTTVPNPSVEFQKISSLQFPVGYQAWIVSKATGLKYQLNLDFSFPQSNHSLDTFVVYVAPLEKLSAIPELEKAKQSIPDLVWNIQKTVSGMVHLQLSLPWACSVEITVVSLNGQIVSKLNPGFLNTGIYSFDLTGRKNSQLAILKLYLFGPQNIQQKSQIVLF